MVIRPLCQKPHKNMNNMKLMKRIVTVIIALCLAACAISLLFPKFSISNSQTEYTSETEASQKKEVSVKKGEEYCTHEEVAEYIHLYKELPPNYMTKDEARDKGWENGNPQKVLGGNVCIGGSKFGNSERSLPEGVEYRECDVDYCDDSRGASRLIYTADGKVYFTEDHYESFVELY